MNETKDFMKMGRQENIKESVDVSMKKVMIDSANNSEKNSSGGKIMTEGNYSAKKNSGEASPVSYKYKNQDNKGDR